MILWSTGEDSTLALKCPFSVSYYCSQRYCSANSGCKTLRDDGDLSCLFTWKLVCLTLNLAIFHASFFFFFYVEYNLNYFIAKLKRFGRYHSALTSLYFLSYVIFYFIKIPLLYSALLSDWSIIRLSLIWNLVMIIYPGTKKNWQILSVNEQLKTGNHIVTGLYNIVW